MFIDVHVCRVWKPDGFDGGKWKNVSIRSDTKEAQEWMRADIRNREYDTFALELDNLAAYRDLLEALESSLDSMERVFSNPAPNGQIVKARKAIAKARGTSSS